MRKLIIVGNWKMHTTPASSRELARKLREGLDGFKAVDVGVCPPATSIPAVADALGGSSIAWGAQNAHWEEEGAFTGEVSVKALKELDCTYAILGHSERRHIFGETDEMVAKRLAFVQKSGMIPILCVGETEAERQAGETEKVLERQLDTAVDELDSPPAVVAYEPVWAIGTGKRAQVSDVEAVHRFIRTRLNEKFNTSTDDVRIVYGGSVKPANVAELAGCEEIDGALVGGASLDADSFCTIVTRAFERRSN
ncbi:triose-phosphate isomerase [candidate division WOR-3 bacterium]|uniref:Triosephosphate isomerase n=1 Tax=candidate division WOR-3 bacterium TaxID=2052148 RepID=A0A9D5QCJ1_UNCW3|nr:triose-phosphate isomerase [candidate division WOR-3 bacterium]MBD3364738.1 triose-phosphate isomerase [candidate division WOR-3 bacterium]